MAKKTTEETAIPEEAPTLMDAIGAYYGSLEKACLAFGVDYETEGDEWVDSVTFRRTAAGWVTEINGTKK